MRYVLKRILVGRPIHTEDAAHTLLPKRLALPVFSSDPLSSVAYATQEILLVLSLGGLAYIHLTPYLAAAVVMLLVVVTVSYRQTVREYPSGGGAYIVAHENIGENAGLTAASALLVDYVLTVAVSVAAGVDAITSASPGLADKRTAMAIGFVVFITLMNLRGVKESGTLFAIPTYGFVVGIYVLIGWALVRLATGATLVAESAHLEVPAHKTYSGLALGLLVMRAFASGCTALTGVEAISNGVPAFKSPKSKNAATTLLWMAFFSISMFVGITALALVSDVHITEESTRTVVAQIAAAVFGDRSFGFYYVQVFTAGILILAANTAYQDFPRLASILSHDNYLPRQLASRGDRLVFSNGVLLLAAFSCLLLWAFHAEVTRLIQLYIVGVFVSFTLSQAGMVRHWQRVAPEERRSKYINAFGACFTFVVLVIVLYSKFTHGAWIVVLAMPLIFLVMKGIRRHYREVSAQIHVEGVRPVLPARNHVVVLVSSLSVPTVRALDYARSINPHSLQAVSIAVDPDAVRRLEDEWVDNKIDIPLVSVSSPYRDLTKPLVDYVKRLRGDGANDVVTVVIPEFVVQRWWEQLLHGQSALLMKLALLRTPGVVVTNVPWHLGPDAIRPAADPALSRQR